MTASPRKNPYRVIDSMQRRIDLLTGYAVAMTVANLGLVVWLIICKLY